MYDIIIVGGGAAGCSAAIYAQRRGLNSILLTKDIGGQVLVSGNVFNYPGFDEINGIDLAQKFKDHMITQKVNFKKDVEIVSVEKKDNNNNNNNNFILQDKNDNIYESKMVIWCTGSTPKLLKVPGEKELTNKGVSYCAVCDGALFKDKEVIVIGGGCAALESVIQLEKIAKKISLITIDNELADEGILTKKVKSLDKIKIITKATTKEIQGDKFVTGIIYEKDSEQKLLKTDGIFIMIGREPHIYPIKHLIDTDKHEHIIVNMDQETKTEGLYAAGDCTNMHNYQICTAVGEGCTAFLRAAMRIQSK